jgi:hypothetical protein
LDAGAGLAVGGAAGLGGGYSSSSSYESSGYSAGGLGGAGFGVGGVESAFVAADTNQDGTLDQGEFSNFVSKYFFQKALSSFIDDH